MSPQRRDYPRYAYQILSGARAAMESEAAARRWRDIAPYLNVDDKLDILDVGNGRLRPQYSILRGKGHRVTGLDFVNRPQMNWRELAYGTMRKLYTAQLGLSAATIAPVALVGGDVGHMPFQERSFDLAVSAAAFEHFLNVPAVLDNIRHVLRPGGLLWVAIHLFTCPSGGHNLSFTEYPLQTIPPGVDVWDHLRQRQLPFSVPLNEWRKDAYLDAFAKRFEILKSYCALREGAQWLTPEIRVALEDYTEDELTCATFVIIARRTRDA